MAEGMINVVNDWATVPVQNVNANVETLTVRFNTQNKLLCISIITASTSSLSEGDVLFTIPTNFAPNVAQKFPLYSYAFDKYVTNPADSNII